MDETTEKKIRNIFESLKKEIDNNTPPKEGSSSIVRIGICMGIEMALESIAYEFNAEEILKEYGDFD